MTVASQKKLEMERVGFFFIVLADVDDAPHFNDQSGFFPYFAAHGVVNVDINRLNTAARRHPPHIARFGVYMLNQKDMFIFHHQRSGAHAMSH